MCKSGFFSEGDYNKYTHRTVTYKRNKNLDEDNNENMLQKEYFAFA